MDNYNFVYDNQNSDEMMQRAMYYQLSAKQERKEIRKLGNILGLVLIAFVAIQYICVLLLQAAVGFYDAYETSYIFQTSFTVIAVEILALCVPFGLMALANKKKYVTPVIPTKKMSAGSVALWVGFGMLCCIGADYFVGIVSTISNTLGFELTQPDTLEPDSFIACIFCVIGTAVVPAICEEFAMRCCGVGLLRKYGKAFAVTAIAIVFGLVHGNIVQFIFATLVGLILGYVTVKTDSVVPAMFIHGFNNGMSVFSSVVDYACGTSSFLSKNATVILFVFWVVVGVICTTCLAVKKEFKSVQPRQRMPYENSTGQKLATFFFVPGMVLPFAYLIVSTVMTIKH